MGKSHVALVSYRLGGFDGVSIESAKWVRALELLGHSVTTVAGEGAADHLLPGLAIDAPEPPPAEDLEAALADADIVIVENLCSLPLNPVAGRAVAAACHGRRAILHHHDLARQRAHLAHLTDFPPDDPAWVHVVINDLSRGQLAERGIAAVTLRNTFDVNAPPGDRTRTRAALSVAFGERVLLQPTRAIPRKNVPRGLALAEAIDATYWLLGPAEEGYDEEFGNLVSTARVRTILGRPPAMSSADAYAAADAVVLPSVWEGFGNPTVESAVHRRPLAVADYPVAKELAAFGFRWFPSDDPGPLLTWLQSPDDELLEHNVRVARAHFSSERLPVAIDELLRAAGWQS